MVRGPFSVALNESLSLEPAVFEATLNEPLNVRVPETPLYLPDPPVTVATPLTLTLVGVAVAEAQPWDFDDVTTLNVNLLPDPVIEPSPVSSSHWFDAGAEPVARNVLEPRYVPVPLPTSDVTFTDVADWPDAPTINSAMEPLYDPLKVTFFTLSTLACTATCPTLRTG